MSKFSYFGMAYSNTQRSRRQCTQAQAIVDVQASCSCLLGFRGLFYATRYAKAHPTDKMRRHHCHAGQSTCCRHLPCSPQGCLCCCSSVHCHELGKSASTGCASALQALLQLLCACVDGLLPAASCHTQDWTTKPDDLSWQCSCATVPTRSYGRAERLQLHWQAACSTQNGQHVFMRPARL